MGVIVKCGFAGFRAIHHEPVLGTVGTGQHGVLRLSDEAESFFKDHGCKVRAVPTPDAVNDWNKAEGRAVAMFHVTC
jgi:hypothetical protein